jgi:hypothetical protein
MTLIFFLPGKPDSSFKLHLKGYIFWQALHNSPFTGPGRLPFTGKGSIQTSGPFIGHRRQLLKVTKVKEDPSVRKM